MSDEDESDLLEEELKPITDTAPNEAADPHAIVSTKIPHDIQTKYELLSYRNAAIILAEARAFEFNELLNALRDFTITTDMIRKAGGNESEIPKLVSAILRPKGWHETIIQGDLVVRLAWREQIGLTKNGKPIFEKRTSSTRRDRFLDGHKIDYVKNRVAFDFEWNSKDQTFDRDLYAFNAFFQSGIIDVGVLVTRGETLDPVLKQMGPALKRNGEPEFKQVKGETVPRMTREKYGASTTWWGKLIYRLNAGRGGGCPVLAIGITPNCIKDWPPS